MSVVGNHRNRFPIVPRDHARHEAAMIGLKNNAFADFKLQHLDVRVHLIDQSQTLHNPMVEVDEF